MARHLSSRDQLAGRAHPGDPGRMDTAQQLGRHEIGAITWRSAILLGIGDDDTVDAVAESEHNSEQAAKGWVERVM